jgi:hypothetical protein
MKRTLVAATVTLLLWGAPALAGNAPDFDGDGWGDGEDNCSDAANDGQDDTDLDKCGNICDANYDQLGTVGFVDFGDFSVGFGGGDELLCHVQPIPGCTVGFPDFGYFSNAFGLPPGPSGTTTGTVACPL